MVSATTPLAVRARMADEYASVLASGGGGAEGSNGGVVRSAGSADALAAAFGELETGAVGGAQAAAANSSGGGDSAGDSQQEQQQQRRQVPPELPELARAELAGADGAVVPAALRLGLPPEAAAMAGVRYHGRLAVSDAAAGAPAGAAVTDAELSAFGDAFATLRDMGFGAAQATGALQLAGDDVSAAANLCMGAHA